jgi:OPA family glycerol-3-phosphate transporter-like MFS transporter
VAIVSNPVVWITALAYSCTGAVRQSVDQWFPRYMQEVHHLDLESAQFQFLGFMIPFVASVGSLISGYLSDTVFKGRRAPVAAGIYFAETVVILAAAQFHSGNAAICFFILISFTANSTHSLLGTASAMDIGGRKMVGFASGIIDSFQYFGGSLAGYFLGRLLDRSWGYYFYFMAPFGLVGGLLMLCILGKISAKTSETAVPSQPGAR